MPNVADWSTRYRSPIAVVSVGERSAIAAIVEGVAEPLEEGQVDGLGDGAEPGDPEAHAVGRPAGGWLGGHRAEYIEGRR